jgi:ATP-dependent Clp endopeptidase proteolytic subunit ClpP
MSEPKRTPEEAAAAVEKDQALARKHRAEAELEEYKAAKELIDLQRKQFEEAKRLATDEHHRIYRFSDSVSDKSVEACVSQLSTWHRLDVAVGSEPRPLTVVFNSPGGSVIDGMALFDFIQEIREAGHEVTTLAQGMAASMAGILLQAGDKRVMTSQSWLMIHQASYGAVGSHYKVEDTVKWVERIQERILEIFTNRAKNSEAVKPITKATIKRNWNRKDWWITSDEALACGLIDRIDSSLSH